MPQGDKDAYSDKQKRQAEHIEDSVRERGGSEDEAGRIAWATVNKQDGGGKKSGSRRARSKSSSSGAGPSKSKASSGAGRSKSKTSSGRGGKSKSKAASGRGG